MWIPWISVRGLVGKLGLKPIPNRGIGIKIPLQPGVGEYVEVILFVPCANCDEKPVLLKMTRTYNASAYRMETDEVMPYLKRRKIDSLLE